MGIPRILGTGARENLGCVGNESEPTRDVGFMQALKAVLQELRASERKRCNPKWFCWFWSGSQADFVGLGRRHASLAKRVLGALWAGIEAEVVKREKEQRGPGFSAPDLRHL